MNKPVVAIFSDSNFLGVYLVESLLAKNCEVIVFAPDKSDWRIKTSHISSGAGLAITDEKNFIYDPNVNYTIFLSGFLKSLSPYKKFLNFYSKEKFGNVKSIAIFPAELFDNEENSNLPVNSNLSIIYLGDLLAPRIDMAGELRINQLVMEILSKKSISVGIGEVFHPLFAPSVAKLITTWLFSFGPFGKEVFILGQEVSGTSFWKETSKIILDTKLYNDSHIKVRQIPRGFAREIIESNLSYLLRETFRGVLLILRNQKPQSSPKRKMDIRIKAALIGISLFLITPFLLLAVSGGLLFLSVKLYLSGRPEVSKNILYISAPISRVGEGESKILKYIPVLGYVYKETAYASYLGKEASGIGLEAISVLEVSKEYMNKILGNEIYDPGSLAKEMGRNMESIYQKVSMLQAETLDESLNGVQSAKKVLDYVDFEKIKSLSFSGTKISESLPILLGKEEQKTYLLLFQNNMELRPTGGFIGSFALVTFDGGRMTDFSVSDVYSADGQLKGHIEPPKPIKDYLGEASWFLRDSNWDPDFPTSAKRAEWFIDKEIDRQVDGVIGIDLSPVKDALNYTGPIYLADYQIDITKDNLYEKTQEEVQEDFFPGTHKKASFLTALSRNLVLLLSSLDSRQKAGILKTVFNNFEERHIQMYLHDEKTQDLISQIGWAGEVGKKECKEACYADFLGLVEANVGVNKANYFVSRDMDLKVKFEDQNISRNLTVTFNNTANPSLGAAAKYKSYVRLLVPSDSQVEGSFDVTEGRGLKEIGFLVEVLAGQEKEVNISWSGKADNGNYALYVRKQAGTERADKLSVAYGGDVVYNSNLTKDVWIPKP